MEPLRLVGALNIQKLCEFHENIHLVIQHNFDLNLEFKSNAISKPVGVNGMTLNPLDCKAFTACITALRQPGVDSKIPS